MLLVIRCWLSGIQHSLPTPNEPFPVMSDTLDSVYGNTYFCNRLAIALQIAFSSFMPSILANRDQTDKSRAT